MDIRAPSDSLDAIGADGTVYVGVDGGGSTCRVRVRDRQGVVLGEAFGGAANVYLDFAAAIDTLKATVTAALASVTGTAADRPAIGLGLAGVSSDAVAQRVSAALSGLGVAVVVTSDADIACLGAHAGQDGGLIIAGTGSGAVARIGGRRIAMGGRGFILGDDGSGARLGLEALRAALRAHDGLMPHSALSRRLMARFHDDPVAVIAWGRSARSSDYAALAPQVIDAAADGDANAIPLVQQNVDALVQHAKALRRRGVTRLSFVGGLAAPLAPFLPADLREALSPPRLDALDGALLLAGCPALSARRSS